MKRKLICFTELAYVLGLLFLAFGTALMERADFGMSMVVAPAYLIYLKLSIYFPFFTFGMAEYLFQAFLLFILCLVLKSFRRSYLFSFVTAILYGLLLDLCIHIVGLLPFSGTLSRYGFFIGGLIACTLGVAFMFHTYISAEVYELFVKEVSQKYHLPISKTKTVYDCVSCLIGILLSFAFFGFGVFRGVKLGTILCALINGALIGFFSKKMDDIFSFEDLLTLRKHFVA